MATLPPLTQQNVGEIVGSKTRLYQPEGPRIPGDPRYANKPSNATPRNMRALLDELELYTAAVREAAEKEGLTGDSVQAQWQSDMANWQYRLAHYYEVLQMVPPEQADSLEGADTIYFQITAPLLDGVYYEVLPGIVLNEEEKSRIAKGPPEGFSNRKPPGLYLPFSLGNQVIIYRDHQRERWDLFWKDLEEGLRTVGGLVPSGDPLGALKHALVTVGSGLGGALVTYIGITTHEYRRRRRLDQLAARFPAGAS